LFISGRRKGFLPETGAITPIVSVTAANDSTGVVSTAVSNAFRLRSFPSLTAGIYAVSAEHDRYERYGRFIESAGILRRYHMKRKFGWSALAIMMLTTLLAGSAFTQDAKVTVMNPLGIQPPIRLIPMPERTGIEGKTVYIVDTKYANTRPFINELHKILQERYPKTTWVLRDKIGMYMDDDPKLWEEIKAKGAAAIVAIGH
jgi:hypothetical protein